MLLTNMMAAFLELLRRRLRTSIYLLTAQMGIFYVQSIRRLSRTAQFVSENPNPESTLSP